MIIVLPSFLLLPQVKVWVGLLRCHFYLPIRHLKADSYERDVWVESERSQEWKWRLGKEGGRKLNGTYLYEQSVMIMGLMIMKHVLLSVENSWTINATAISIWQKNSPQKRDRQNQLSHLEECKYLTVGWSDISIVFSSLLVMMLP